MRHCRLSLFEQTLLCIQVRSPPAVMNHSFVTQSLHCISKTTHSQKCKSTGWFVKQKTESQFKTISHTHHILYISNHQNGSDHNWHILADERSEVRDITLHYSANKICVCWRTLWDLFHPACHVHDSQLWYVTLCAGTLWTSYELGVNSEETPCRLIYPPGMFRHDGNTF